MNKTVTLVIRILVGLAMVAFGANKLFHFMPEPEPGAMGEKMTTLMGVLHSPFMVVIGVLEILGGLALLVGKYVPLALTFLIAIMVNAAMLHGFYDPANIAGSLVFLVLCLVLVYAYKERFKYLLSA